MKEQVLDVGNRVALESLISFAGPLFVGSLLAGWFLQRKGRREQDVGVTVFEVFAISASLAMSALAIYVCVYALGSEEAIDDSVVTGVATLVVLSSVLLVLLMGVARFSSLLGGIWTHLSTLSVTLVTAVTVGVSVVLLSPGSEFIIPGAALILAGGAALAWLFLKIERRSITGGRNAIQKRVMSLSANDYRPKEAMVLLSLPESHTSPMPLSLVCWSKKGRSYLDHAACRHLRDEARQRWDKFKEGEARAPLGQPVLMDIDLRYRFLSWPPTSRLTLSIYEEGEEDAKSRTIEANEMGLFDITGLGLVGPTD